MCHFVCSLDIMVYEIHVIQIAHLPEGDLNFFVDFHCCSFHLLFLTISKEVIMSYSEVRNSHHLILSQSFSLGWCTSKSEDSCGMSVQYYR